MNNYLFIGGIASIYISHNIILKINENIKRKQFLNHLYKDYCNCLGVKGFLESDKKIDMNSDFHQKFGKIIENKDVRELESCKSEYFQFMKAYYIYKNGSF